jgi:ABC-type sugar transport system ATPase subunit
MRDTTDALVMESISKSFDSGQVLFDIDLHVAPGEVHALLGQNGAGKSTLIKILAGIYPDYSGHVLIDGTPIKLASVSDAMRAGITVIHQEFSLIPHQTVAESIVLGREPTRGGLLDRRSIRVEAARWLEELGLVLPLDRPVGSLGVAQQQITEIVKAVSRQARVLVMDEPTARLPGPDREVLFQIIRSLADRGVAVIYISHFLEEVLEICDNVTVLRDGKRVGSASTTNLDIDSITSMMVGRVENTSPMTRRPQRTGSAIPLLEATGIEQRPYLSACDLTAAAGEIVALAGLVGAGRSRFARCVIGAEHRTAGTIRVAGTPIKVRRPGDAVLGGIAMVPEDRKTQGLVLGLSAEKNIMLMALRSRFQRFGLVRERAGRATTAHLFGRLQIRPADPRISAAFFSGGNQQKLVLAKALAAQSQILILDQPTAGVDVITKAEIHRQVEALAADGKAIVLISDDVDEIARLADRVLIMSAGRIIAEYPGAQVDHDELVRLIATSRNPVVADPPADERTAEQRPRVTEPEEVK